MKQLFLTLFVLVLSACAATPQVKPCHQVRAAESRVIELVITHKMATDEGQRQVETYVVRRQCDIKEAMKAAGVAYADKEFVTEHFPAPVDCRDGEMMEVILFSGEDLGPNDAFITLNEAKAQMAKRISSAADWTILLPLAAERPELWEKFSIYALGSIWRDANDHVRIPVINVDDYNSERLILNLGYDSPEARRFGTSKRFAAVRK